MGKAPVPVETIRPVGHRVREVQPGVVQVEAQITCEGRDFNGAASGPVPPPDRLRVPALATLRALDACMQIFYLGVSEPAVVLDNVVEVSVGDFPVAVVMITASEKVNATSLVAACPLVGMSDLAIILATLQATTRTVSHWLWGDRSPRCRGAEPTTMTPTDNQSDVGGLVQHVEVRLSSLTAVVSARVILDQEKETHVHIIATAELPVSEVSRAVLSALTWGLGCGTIKSNNRRTKPPVP